MVSIFDSGAGGLSVWRELIKLMPDEEYVYVGDNANCPYGEKPVEYIVRRSEAITRFLVDKGAEIIVIACNTATGAAIARLRQKYPDIPFVGMEPAIKPAALHSKTGVVGVLATANTLKAQKYHDTVEKFASDVKVIERVGQGLVEAVENGTDATPILNRCITPMIEGGADAIVLGCTHYPFLRRQITEIAGPEVEIINPAPAVARRARYLLSTIKDRKRSGTKGTAFYATGHADTLRRLSLAIKPDLPPNSWKEYEKIEG